MTHIASYAAGALSMLALVFAVAWFDTSVGGE